MRIKYFVPTVGRADSITTMDYIKQAVCIVSPEDFPRYKAAHPDWDDSRFLVAPKGIQGNGKGRVLNWMLDTQWPDCDAIITIDDDIHWFAAHMGEKTARRLSENEVYELFENFCLLAFEWGCGMWGLSINTDRLSYSEFLPFSLHSYIDGGVVGYVRNDGIRYDESLTVKEDVDYFLQSLERYHKALRINKYRVYKESFTNQGGGKMFRSAETEQEQFRRMQEKWGSDIIRPNKPRGSKESKIKKYGGAIKLNIPLSGV